MPARPANFSDLFTPPYRAPSGANSPPPSRTRPTKTIRKSVLCRCSVASVTLFDYVLFGILYSGPKFDLVATATLCLDEVHDSIKSHDLILENLGTTLFYLLQQIDLERAFQNRNRKMIDAHVDVSNDSVSVVMFNSYYYDRQKILAISCRFSTTFAAVWRRSLTVFRARM